MKARTLLLTLTLCLIPAGTTFAQAPMMGTWKLDEAKSTIPAGTLKTTTVIYQPVGPNVKITTDGTDLNGKPLHTVWTGKFDGRPYAINGDPTADSRTYTRVSDRALTFKNTKDGKVVLYGSITVWADGKSRTVNTTEVGPSGHTIDSTSLYNKQ